MRLKEPCRGSHLARGAHLLCPSVFMLHVERRVCWGLRHPLVFVISHLLSSYLLSTQCSQATQVSSQSCLQLPGRQNRRKWIPWSKASIGRMDLVPGSLQAEEDPSSETGIFAGHCSVLTKLNIRYNYYELCIGCYLKYLCGLGAGPVFPIFPGPGRRVILLMF